MARFRVTTCALWMLAAIGCGEFDEPAAGPSGGRPVPSGFCRSYDELAERLGCVPLGSECETPPEACDAAATAWTLCLRDDPTQCSCEQDDGTLNCEGSFKPSEGPAKCIVEYERLEACGGL